MTPHPILMHTLHDDRTREVEALVVQRRFRSDLGNAMRAPGPASWHRLATRVLTSLGLTRVRATHTAPGEASPLPCV